MKMLKKMLSVMLSLVLCAGLVAPALAVEYDISQGSVYVSSSDGKTVSHQGDGSSGYSYDTDIVIKGETDKNTVNVFGEVTDTTITLDNVTIDVSGSYTDAALSIGYKSDVTVELNGTNTLISGGSHAGLEIKDDASVTIQDEDKNGSLYAQGGNGGGAGIGTSAIPGSNHASSITIKGGDITAGGGYSGGAGIGSGATTSNGTKAGDPSRVDEINILGGTVTSNGGTNAAGIGAGAGSEFGDITIKNAQINRATGTGYGAGIGGSGTPESNNPMHQNTDPTENGYISIENSNIGLAKGGTAGGAGIGGGGQGNTIGSIEIKDSTVYAIGGTGAAGIGAGRGNDKCWSVVGAVKIRDSKIDASSFSTGTTYGDIDNVGKGDKYSAVGTVTFERTMTEVVDNEDGTTTIITTIKDQDGEGNVVEELGNTTVTVPTDKRDKVETDDNHNTTLPEGTSTESKDDDGNKTVTTYPEGATVDKDGNIDGDSVVTKTEKDDGTVAVDKDGEKFTVNPSKGGDDNDGDDGDDIKIDDDGSVTIPEGGSTDGDKTETTYPDGGKVNPDGTIDDNGKSIEKDKETGDVTIKTGDGETKVTTGDGDGDIVVNPDGSVEVPEGGKVTDKDGNEIDLPFGGTINPDGTITANPDPNAGNSGSGVTPGTTTIDDGEVPLAAGPVTRAQFIDYLWRHEGEPASDGACTFADVAEDHEYVQALAWAEENGIAVAGEDGNFQPDELVTVAAVREFLGNFADVFGAQAVAVADLASLTGADGEAVLNCDEVLAEFFGEELAAAA